MRSYFKQWTPDRSKNLIIGLLAGLVVAELLWAGLILFSEGERAIVPTLPATATLALAPEENVVSGGEEFSLDIVLHTNGRQVSGVDAVIRYDPSMLALVSSARGVAATATSSALFDLYPANSVDTENGVIVLSAIQHPNEIFNGSGTLGRLTFQAASFLTIQSGAAAETTVSFVYEKGASVDSNVSDAKTGEDILGQAVDAVVKIQ